MNYKKLLAIDQRKLRTIRTWGGVAGEDTGMMEYILWTFKTILSGFEESKPYLYMQYEA